MKIKNMNEKIESPYTDDNIPDVEDTTITTNQVFGKAVKGMRYKRKEIADRLKDTNKLADELVDENQRESHMNKKVEEVKKLHLNEYFENDFLNEDLIYKMNRHAKKGNFTMVEKIISEIQDEIDNNENLDDMDKSYYGDIVNYGKDLLDKEESLKESNKIISDDYYVEYEDDDYRLFDNYTDAINNAKANGARRVVLKKNVFDEYGNIIDDDNGEVIWENDAIVEEDYSDDVYYVRKIELYSPERDNRYDPPYGWWWNIRPAGTNYIDKYIAFDFDDAVKRYKKEHNIRGGVFKKDPVKSEESLKESTDTHKFTIEYVLPADGYYDETGDEDIVASSAKEAIDKFNTTRYDRVISAVYDESGILYDVSTGEALEEGCSRKDVMKEDTIKKRNGKWTNRGDDGEEHGEFRTKKQADAQRKAMFANGYKAESKKVMKEFLTESTMSQINAIATHYNTQDSTSAVKDVLLRIAGLSRNGIDSIDRLAREFDINESIEDKTIDEVEEFIDEVKERFPGSEAIFDGDTKTIKITLDDEVKENLKEELEESPVQPGSDVGFANMIGNLIIDEYETIDAYNSALVAAQEEGNDDAIAVLSDIQAEENVHVGQLQKLMQLFDKNAIKVDQGNKEAEEQIDTANDNEIETETEIAIDDSVE